MELQISHRICTEVPEEGIFWRETRSDRKNTKTTMRMEGGRDTRSGNMPGPCTYAGKYPTESGSIEFYGVSERKKQSDDLRTVWESEIQVQRTGILVSRVLCRYGRKEQTKDRRIYPTPVDEDKMGEQLTMFGKDDDPFKGGK